MKRWSLLLLPKRGMPRISKRAIWKWFVIVRKEKNNADQTCIALANLNQQSPLRDIINATPKKSAQDQRKWKRVTREIVKGTNREKLREEVLARVTMMEIEVGGGAVKKRKTYNEEPMVEAT